MRIFSTFTGIGGFEVGIQNAYRSANRASETDTQELVEAGHRLLTTPGQDASASHRSSGASTADSINERPLFVGYSEIDKPAISVYEKHFKGVKNYGDITKINAAELPDFDCLVGGFPCQAFSIAGKRRGFEDTRGTLFFDLARILQAKQPRLFVFENVKGLLSHDGGNTIKTILTTIAELGYDAQWQVLNSKNFGVPQNRERIIIVGHRRGTPRPQVFPLSRASDSHNFIRTIRTGGAGSFTEKHARDIVRINNPKHSTNRVYATDGISPAISTMQGGGRQPYIKIPEATKKGYAEAVAGQAINLKNINSKTRRGRVSDISPSLETSNQLYTLTEDTEIRRITPLECERLQAFPDEWTRYGISDKALVDHKGGYYTKESIWNYPILKHITKTVRHNDPVVLISDSQRYKMCGNAVTTNVIQAVFEQIFNSQKGQL